MGKLYNSSIKLISTMDDAAKWRLAKIIIGHIRLNRAMLYYVKSMIDNMFALSNYQTRDVFTFYQQKGHALQHIVEEEGGLSEEAAKQYYIDMSST